MKSYHTLVGVLFLVGALFHAYRAMTGMVVTVGTWEVPMWVSYLGVVVAGYLSYMSFKLK